VFGVEPVLDHKRLLSPAAIITAFIRSPSRAKGFIAILTIVMRLNHPAYKNIHSKFGFLV
ncbi:MAG: hypothetical protein MUF59_10250, partial [Candidatus Krumholzibacteria bacterium]|nr:hypothetical protein [Candidatus Krumholzibacteria bacterium]